MALAEMYTGLGSAVAGLMFLWAMFQQFFPDNLRFYVETKLHKLMRFASPYIEITFHERQGKYLKRSEAFSAIKNYLSANTTQNAKRLKADVAKESESLVLTMEDREEVTDNFNGAKVWWSCIKTNPRTQSISLFPADDEKRYFKLTFHRRHREMIMKSYIDHVLKRGKEIVVEKRQRKLFTNNPNNEWYRWRGGKWSHVAFEHPATFDTLAMEEKKKKEIMKDLIKFSKGKEYYNKVGKAWKRGYLLYGPPGTGKSTMISAMANLLDYDVYDLELTIVKDNSELKKLLIETTNKSIIVIEDIDCSLDLTGQRKEKKKSEGEEEAKDPISKEKKKADEEQTSKVTLSGLLNFIDGIWSSCGGERIIVFTTNFVDKLDPALIRRGRMDKHIEMSYCCFEAFKVLAKNYLDVESHELFERIRHLLEETMMTPADVAENLMPKSDEEDEEICLKALIVALEEAKEKEARKKADKEEEAKKKATDEEEARKKPEEKA